LLPARRPRTPLPRLRHNIFDAGADASEAPVTVAHCLILDRAGDFPQSLPLAANRGPVYLIRTGESVETPMGGQKEDFTCQMEDFTSSRAFRITGAKAFAEARTTGSRGGYRGH
jgi:hypothetical protein